MKKLILFELNEVPWRIVEEFCAWRPDSCLARNLARFTQYETHAEDSGHLSPWVTWPTVHRGVTNERHAIGEFGQDLSEINRAYPPLWSLLAKQGISTGVFGSLHSYPLADLNDNYSFYVPDTFAAGSECFPDTLSAFQELNLSMTAASARNVVTDVPWKPALKLLARFPALGLRVGTLFDMGKQLLGERIAPWKRARRRTCQVVLGFDIFYKQLCRTQPQFATFFTNHVASSMHRFWAATFPADYAEFHMDDQWVATYRNEIDYTMSRLDGFLSRLLKFVERRPEYTLLVASSMGQAATRAEPVESELYVKDARTFVAALGAGHDEWTPRSAMWPDFCFLAAPHREVTVRNSLTSLHVDGRPVAFTEASGGFFRVRLGHANLLRRETTATLHGRPVTFADLGLENFLIDEGAPATAYHVPQGVLLSFNSASAAARRSVASHSPAARTQLSTRDIAPLILRHFDAAIPPYMRSASAKAA